MHGSFTAQKASARRWHGNCHPDAAGARSITIRKCRLTTTPMRWPRLRRRSSRCAKDVLATEARAVQALADRLDESFVDAVRIIQACTGRIVVTGIGKSGHIARKIAATLASTGTPAFFVHSAEASHGDLGMITPRRRRHRAVEFRRERRSWWPSCRCSSARARS